MGMHALTFTTRDDEDYVVLSCPACGDNQTHVDDVAVAGRPREDGEIHRVSVDSAGRVSQGPNVVVPFGAHGDGRRHTISLMGYCEVCGSRFAFAFKQHKGETHVSTLLQRWAPIEQ